MNALRTERLLTIDVKPGRESYDEDIVEDIIWIRRNYKSEDPMTKASILSQLI